MTTDGPPAQRPVLVVMGVSGCGKSTVAGIVAGRLGWDLEEGDELHPEANVTKMAAGTPLTDEDRWPWLALVAGWIREHTAAGQPGVITCSALRRRYRDRLRGDHVLFVHLAGTRETIGHRLAARTDHFMPAGLLDSQLATLEPLEPDENALVVDVAGKSAAELAAEIIGRLRPGTGTG
jgi:gluconokinase